jgi:hypothetical protein
MTSVTMTETRFAATPAVAQRLTDSPDRAIAPSDTIAAALSTIRCFVSRFVHAPVLPIEAMLEASVLVAMLEDHTGQQSDTFRWNMPVDVWPMGPRA